MMTSDKGSSGSESGDSYTPEAPRQRPRPQPRARARAAPAQTHNLMPSRHEFMPKPTPPKRNKIKQPISESEASDSDDDVSRASSIRKAAVNIQR